MQKRASMVAVTFFNVLEPPEVKRTVMQLDVHFLESVLTREALVTQKMPDELIFSIDSRSIQPGEIFVALKGQQLDGHTFVLEAVRKGAAGFMIKHTHKALIQQIPETQRNNLLIMVVDDPYEALLALARAWRATWDKPVVAVTGSVGKTSTKELVALITQEAGLHYYVSRANQNVLVSVAINMLQVRAEHAGALFELATSKPGDIRAMVELVQPTVAAVTNVGHQHMDEFGSLHEIGFEKRSVFSTFSETNIGVICGDQPLLTSVSYKHPVLRVGLKTINQIQARKICVQGDEISFLLKIYGEKYPVTLTQAHEGRVMNVLIAAGVAHLLGISNEVIVRAVQQPLHVPGRFEHCTIKQGKGTIINDTYNANPESVKAALLAFEKIPVATGARKIAVLGDMRGLGPNAPFWHRQIGRFLRKVQSLHQLILVGSEVAWTKKTAPLNLPIEVVQNWQEAVALLEKLMKDQVLVLVKGSRSLHLENVVNTFVHHEKAAERSRVWHQ
jgi:UDP-N-acetylmuramoyl-tripeptide--D-alanyl-D-alanine ligase